MQGVSKISSFLFLMLVKGKNERVGFKISCVAAGMEKLSRLSFASC